MDELIDGDVGNLGASRNEDGTETNSCLDSSMCTDEGVPCAAGMEKESPIIFTVSPTGMSTSNLWCRISHKVQISARRVT